LNQEIANRLTTLLFQLNDLLKEAAEESLKRQLEITPEINQDLFLRFVYLTFYNQFIINFSNLVAKTYSEGLRFESYYGEILR